MSLFTKAALSPQLLSATKGTFFGENANPDFRIQKLIFRHLGQIQKRIMNP